MAALSVPSPLLHNFSTQPGSTHTCNPPHHGQHMREAAERRQQLELEHEQALAVLNAKQQEIDLLQKVRETRLSLGSGGSGCVPASWVKDLCVAQRCWTACAPTRGGVTSETPAGSPGSLSCSPPPSKRPSAKAMTMTAFRTFLQCTLSELALLINACRFINLNGLGCDYSIGPF